MLHKSISSGLSNPSQHDRPQHSQSSRPAPHMPYVPCMPYNAVFCKNLPNVPSVGVSQAYCHPLMSSEYLKPFHLLLSSPPFAAQDASKKASCTVEMQPHTSLGGSAPPNAYCRRYYQTTNATNFLQLHGSEHGTSPGNNLAPRISSSVHQAVSLLQDAQNFARKVQSTALMPGPQDATNGWYNPYCSAPYLHCGAPVASQTILSDEPIQTKRPAPRNVYIPINKIEKVDVNTASGEKALTNLHAKKQSFSSEPEQNKTLSSVRMGFPMRFEQPKDCLSTKSSSVGLKSQGGSFPTSRRSSIERGPDTSSITCSSTTPIANGSSEHYMQTIPSAEPPTPHVVSGQSLPTCKTRGIESVLSKVAGTSKSLEKLQRWKNLSPVDSYSTSVHASYVNESEIHGIDTKPSTTNVDRSAGETEGIVGPDCNGLSCSATDAEHDNSKTHAAGHILAVKGPKSFEDSVQIQYDESVPRSQNFVASLYSHGTTEQHGIQTNLPTASIYDTGSEIALLALPEADSSIEVSSLSMLPAVTNAAKTLTDLPATRAHVPNELDLIQWSHNLHSSDIFKESMINSYNDAKEAFNTAYKPSHADTTYQSTCGEQEQTFTEVPRDGYDSGYLSSIMNANYEQSRRDNSLTNLHRACYVPSVKNMPSVLKEDVPKKGREVAIEPHLGASFSSEAVAVRLIEDMPSKKKQNEVPVDVLCEFERTQYTLSEKLACKRLQRFYRHVVSRCNVKLRLKRIQRFLRAVEKIQRWWRRLLLSINASCQSSFSLFRETEVPNYNELRCGNSNNDERHLTALMTGTARPLKLLPQDQQIVPTIAKRLFLRGALNLSLPECEIHDARIEAPRDSNKENVSESHSYLRRKSQRILQPSPIDLSRIASRFNSNCTTGSPVIKKPLKISAESVNKRPTSCKPDNPCTQSYEQSASKFSNQILGECKSLIGRTTEQCTSLGLSKSQAEASSLLHSSGKELSIKTVNLMHTPLKVVVKRTESKTKLDKKATTVPTKDSILGSYSCENRCLTITGEIDFSYLPPKSKIPSMTLSRGGSMANDRFGSAIPSSSPNPSMIRLDSCRSPSCSIANDTFFNFCEPGGIEKILTNCSLPPQPSNVTKPTDHLSCKPT